MFTERPLRIYLASSWRNPEQPGTVVMLREAGHEVYDFRNPAAGNDGFRWSEIDPEWQRWTPGQYLAALEHPVAQYGFKCDMDALRACDVCVLLLPCGRSAHLELGWAAGAGKRTAALMLGPEEPELMYRMLDVVVSNREGLLLWLLTVQAELRRNPPEPRFELRAQDRCAPYAVRAWADRARGSGEVPAEKIAGAMERAGEMDRWQESTGRAKWPD